MRQAILRLSRARGVVGLWSSRGLLCGGIPNAQNGTWRVVDGGKQGSWQQMMEIHGESSSGGIGDGHGNSEGSGAHKVDFERELLERALGHVEACGWSHKALQQAAVELNLSKAAAGSITDGPARLILLSMSKSNKLALEALEKVARGTGGKDQTQWLSQCLRVRLEITANLSGDLKQGSGLVHKHPGHIPGSARILSNPKHALEAAKLVHEFIDAIWRLSGDQSMDLTWYSKRIALAGILSGAKVHMATDFSPGFIDTWKFIDDKVERMLHAQSLASGGPTALLTLAQDAQQAMKRQLGFMVIN